MIYEYKCLACRKIFEVSKSVEEASTVEKCPYCGEVAKRIYTPPIVWGETVVKEQDI